MIGLVAGCRSSSVAGYKGPTSDHFNGTQFFGSARLPPHSLWSVLNWRFNRRRIAAWPQRVSSITTTAPLEAAPAHGLRLTFVNHATWLIQIDGLNLLTDPICSRNAGP